MDFGAIVGTLPLVWGMFWFGRHGMCEASKGAFDIARHGNVAGASVIIPVKSEATVALAFPIDAGFVAFVMGVNQELCIIVVGIFDTKIIDDECKAIGCGSRVSRDWG